MTGCGSGQDGTVGATRSISTQAPSSVATTEANATVSETNPTAFIGGVLQFRISTGSGTVVVNGFAQQQGVTEVSVTIVAVDGFVDIDPATFYLSSRDHPATRAQAPNSGGRAIVPTLLQAGEKADGYLDFALNDPELLEWRGADGAVRATFDLGVGSSAPPTTAATEEPPQECIDCGVDPDLLAGGSSVLAPGGADIAYPDGLQVTVESISVADPEAEGMTYGAEPGDSAVLIALRLENVSTVPILLSDNFNVDLMYGANGYEGQGFVTDGGPGDLPARIVPGSAVPLLSRFLVSGVDNLVITINPDPTPSTLSVYTDYLFYDVEALVPPG